MRYMLVAFWDRYSGIVFVGMIISAMIGTAILRLAVGTEYLYGLDAYWNMRGIEYLLENGIVAYYAWNDELSWWPDGRNVSATSQVMLHYMASATFVLASPFVGLGQWLVLFPVMAGMLTVPVTYLFVRYLTGNVWSGVVAAMMIGFIPGMIWRGMAGWLKSEPLGILLAVCGMTLLWCSMNRNDLQRVVLACAGGVVFACSLSAWPGTQYFVIVMLGVGVIGSWFMSKYNVSSMVMFFGALLIGSFMFERPGLGFIFGLQGLVIFASVCLMGFMSLVRKRVSMWILVFSVGMIMAIVAVLVLSDAVEMPSGRYLSVFGVSGDALLGSIGEHLSLQSPGLIMFSMMAFGGIVYCGVMCWRRSTEMERLCIIFAGVIGGLGVWLYFSYARLMLLADISFVIAGSACLALMWKRGNSVVLGIVFLMIVIAPVIYQIERIGYDIPPSPLLTGGTFTVTGDWVHALDWIKHNTPTDSKIVSWWDYGYWIGTLGERTTYMDGSTHDAERIIEFAKMFTGSVDAGYEKLVEVDADYVLVFFSVSDVGVGPSGESIYLFGTGGDETKMIAIAEIAGRPLQSSTDWNNTFMGYLAPYKFDVYGEPNGYVSKEWEQGLDPLYVKQYIDDERFELVYESPSGIDGRYDQTVILIYKVQ